MKKNIALLFLILLFVVTTMSTIYLFSKNIDIKKEIEDLNAQIVENSKKYEEELSNIEKEEKVVLPVFDAKRIENKSDDMEVRLNSISKLGLSVRLDENNKVQVQVTDAIYFQSFNGNLNEEHEVEGISGKVVDVNIFNQGNGINPQIVMLLEDGTVEYVNIEELKQGNYISAGKIEGIEDITKIVEVNVRIKDANGYITIGGVKRDGSSVLFPELVSARKE